MRRGSAFDCLRISEMFVAEIFAFLNKSVFLHEVEFSNILIQLGSDTHVKYR